LLILIECKNYNHPVPVDDAEEFFAKLQQISGANIKGIIASTSGFQESTLKYCNSKGIGLLRYFDNSDFKWVLHRSPSNIHLWSEINYNLTEIYRGLIFSTHLSRHFDFYCCYDDRYTHSLKTFLSEVVAAGFPNRLLLSQLTNSREETQPLVDFVSKEEIERLTAAILTRIDYCGGPVPLNQICDWQSAEVGLTTRIGIQPTGRDLKVGALGRIRFDLPEITIYDLPNTTAARQRFTLAHELGHHFLGHARYMNSEYCDATDLTFDNTSTFVLDDLRRMDWQANYFGSCLLLPRATVVEDVLRLAEERDVRNRGFGLLYVDEQKCNEVVYNGIASHLKLIYKVSGLALKVRLETLGLLRDVRTTDQSFLKPGSLRHRSLDRFDGIQA
jgi:Zn-dependent peptidase ImmA (M78 family)